MKARLLSLLGATFILLAFCVYSPLVVAQEETEDNSAPPEYETEQGDQPVYQDFEGTPTLIIMPLRPQGIDSAIAENLTDLMALEVDNSGLFEVYSKTELMELLKLAEYKQLLGEDDDEALTVVGKKLGARFLLHGSIGKVGNTYVLSLVLVEVATAKAVRRVNQTLVGEPGGLIGSLRSAVIALSLQERGVAPDITGELIHDLTIAEKKKTFFFHLRLGYEIPIGEVQNDSSLKYALPSLLTMTTDFAWQFHPYFQLVASTGMGISIMEDFHNQNKQMIVRLSANENLDDAGNPQQQEGFDITSSRFDYQTMRIPFDLMVQVRPKSGKFLPYFGTGLGVSYQLYSFNDEKIKRHQPGYPEPPCANPYLAEGDICIREYDLAAPDSLSYMNIDFPVVAGFDYLIGDHVGISIEAKYLLTYALKDDLYADFIIDEPVEYTNENGNQTFENMGDTVPLRRLHQGISFSVGVIAYY